MAYGQDYDRSQLIPKVTRLMNDNDDGLSHEQDENKLKFCKRWGEALTEKGLIQRKTVILADDGDSAPITFDTVPAGTLLQVQVRRVKAWGA